MRICAFLIIAFVIRFLESIISKLDTGEIAGFLIVSVAEETGLNLALLKTPGTGFSRQDQFCTRWIKILTFCLPTGHFWATSSTPLSANGPLLGHLSGFDF